MTYDAFERSIQGGSPIELFVFSQGGTITRLTSADRDIDFGGVTYESQEITRSKIPTTNEHTSTGRMSLKLQTDNIVVQSFQNILPSSEMTLELLRFHADDPDEESRIIFRGTVISANYEDDGLYTQLVCMPLLARLQRVVPRFTYSSVCNHTLFDAQCLVSQAANSFVTTITTIDPTTGGLEIEIQDLATAGPGTGDALFYQGGRLVTVDGEIRGIYQQNIGSNANRVQIRIPLDFATVGTQVTVIAGCAHDAVTCDTKFNNRLRFGGFRYIPPRNPHLIDLNILG